MDCQIDSHKVIDSTIFHHGKNASVYRSTIFHHGKNASVYRTTFEAWLLDIMESLG
jgi:hypothetical protein